MRVWGAYEGLKTKAGEERWTRDVERLSQGCTVYQLLQKWPGYPTVAFALFSAPAWSSAPRHWTTAVDFTITQSAHNWN